MVFLTLHKPEEYNLQVSFPTEWDELTTGELLAVCRLQLAAFRTSEEGRAAIFGELLKSRCAIHKELPADFVRMLNPQDLADIGYQLVEFLFTGNNRTVQPHKEIILPGTKQKLVGPADAFNSLTCGEFEDTEIFFNQFIAKPEHDFLATLAAILYRAADTPYMRIDNNVAVSYDHKPNFERFKKLAPEFLYSVFAWYAGCRSWLPIMFPTVHESNEGNGTDEPDMAAFTKCIHAGAGPKNGTRTQIRMMPLKEFFFDMEQEAIQAKKLKEPDEQR